MSGEAWRGPKLLRKHGEERRTPGPLSFLMKSGPVGSSDIPVLPSVTAGAGRKRAERGSRATGKVSTRCPSPKGPSLSYGLSLAESLRAGERMGGRQSSGDEVAPRDEWGAMKKPGGKGESRPHNPY